MHFFQLSYQRLRSYHAVPPSSLRVWRECLFAVTAHRSSLGCLYTGVTHQYLSLAGKGCFWKLGTHGTGQFLRVWSKELRADIPCVLLGGQELTGLDEFWVSVSFSEGNCFSSRDARTLQAHQYGKNIFCHKLNLFCCIASSHLFAFWSMDRRSDI